MKGRFNPPGDYAWFGDNVLSFGQSVDLIGGDMTGPVWLLKFGRSLSESEEDAPFVFADPKADVRLFDCFALAPPPPQPLQAQPLSNRSDTDTSPSQLTRPKTVFSAPIGPDMSLGHLPAGGYSSQFPPFCVDWSCFGPSKKKAEGARQAASQGHTLGCP